MDKLSSPQHSHPDPRQSGQPGDRLLEPSVAQTDPVYLASPSVAARGGRWPGRLRWGALALLGAALVAGSSWGYQAWKNSGGEPGGARSVGDRHGGSKHGGKSKGQGEKTAVVEQSNAPVTLTANGTVQPIQAVNVSPKSAGILKKLWVKEGDRVTQGQTLATMDDSDLQGQLLQNQGQVAAAQATLAQLKAGNRPQDIAQAQAKLAASQANLAKLEAGNRVQDIAQAQAKLAAAQANLAKLEAGNRPQDIAQAQFQVKNAQAKLEGAKRTWQQNQKLYATGAIAERDLSDSQAAYEAALATLEEAQQKLNLQKAGTRPEDIAQARAQVAELQQSLNLQKAGTRPEDIAQARAQVAELQQSLNLQRAGARPEEIAAAEARVMSAQGSLKTTQTQIRDTVLRAPFSGIITRIYADPGAFVTPTTSSSSASSATSSSILALASTNQIVARVPEINIPKIKRGQGVTIEADAYPGQTFQGGVTAVATQSTVEQNVTNFEVHTSLEDRDRQLQSGMNVSVKFDIGRLDNALVIPTVAIVRQVEGTGVFLAGTGPDQPAQFQLIETGISLEDKTVVLSGLKAGDRMLLSFPKGERPKSRTPSLIPGMGPSGGGGSGGQGGRRGGGQRGGG